MKRMFRDRWWVLIVLGSAVWGAAGCRHTRPTPAVNRLDAGQQASYEAHVRDLRDRLPGRAFSIVVEPPFVLISDAPSRQLRRYASRVVRPSQRYFRKAFFAQGPDHIIDVWLFRNQTSYQKNVPALFGHEPASHFGYVSAEHHALIVNIDTGAGTLRHELVHPFVAANLPGCPPWFDEGLASLFERVVVDGSDLRAVPNWRLALLQEAIRQGDTIPFTTLMGQTPDVFYQDTLGIHYAQSRYLCFYLQEKGLLISFCKAFTVALATDPTGHDTLCKILEVDDLVAFQREWNTFVMALTFH